ncbi:MAG: hypothetical protein ACK505_00105 [Flavobacteriales bacterium]|jgi:hypothetical protein
MDLNIATKSSTKPGLTKVLYALKSTFTTIAEPPASPTTQAQKVTIADDHVFASGQGWREAFMNDDRTNLAFEGQGDRFSKTGKLTLNLIIPGDEKTVAAMIKDDPEMILLIQKNPCQSGAYYQLGTKCKGATIEGGATWASGVADGSEVMGWEIPISCNQDTLYYYEGEVTLPTP